MHSGDWCPQIMHDCMFRFKQCWVFVVWGFCFIFSVLQCHDCTFSSHSQFHIDLLPLVSSPNPCDLLSCRNSLPLLYCMFIFIFFIQLPCINNYISVSTNLAVDPCLGGNSHTVVGVAWKNSNISVSMASALLKIPLSRDFLYSKLPAFF